MLAHDSEDELTAAVSDAVQQLTQIKKAGVLLNTTLTLIEDGQWVLVSESGILSTR
jgi:hypothetical protein